jgi:hypothetical protein
MAQYNITATSAKKTKTVSNTDTKRFPSPAEFADQATANTQAEKYAKSLNHEDHEQVWDWVGTATAV